MIKLSLDEEIKEMANNLTHEELIDKSNYVYRHNILDYALQGLYHVHTFRKALGTINPFIFMIENGIEIVNPGGSSSESLIGKFDVIEKEGIFIPNQAYSYQDNETVERKVILFNPYFRKKIYSSDWKGDRDFALRLTSTDWRPGIFIDERYNDQGIEFGKSLWDTELGLFNGQILNCTEGVKSFAPKLIEYLNTIVHQPEIAYKK